MCSILILPAVWLLYGFESCSSVAGVCSVRERSYFLYSADVGGMFTQSLVLLFLLWASLLPDRHHVSIQLSCQCKRLKTSQWVNEPTTSFLKHIHGNAEGASHELIRLDGTSHYEEKGLFCFLVNRAAWWSSWMALLIRVFHFSSEWVFSMTSFHGGAFSNKHLFALKVAAVFSLWSRVCLQP